MHERKESWKEVWRATLIVLGYCAVSLATFIFLLNARAALPFNCVPGLSAGSFLINSIQNVALPIAFLLFLLIRFKSISEFGFNAQSPRLAIIFLAAYLLLFLLLGDKTPAGIYACIYSLTVGLSEEFVFRGFLFTEIHRALNKTTRAFTVACVISGLLWGAMHAAVPVVVYDEPFFLAAVSRLGGGVFFGAFFAFLLYKTRSIYVPSLLHASLDYLGFITL